MSQFGKARFFGFDDVSEPGVPSYLTQLGAGLRSGRLFERVSYLLRANYAYNYIFWLRTRSNDPAWVARGGRIERFLKQPFGRRAPRTERARAFRDTDYHFEEQAIAPAMLDAFAHELYRQPVYHDPYVAGFRHEGAPEASDHPFLYMDPQRIFESEAFLRIASSRALIDFCREVLGPSAAISWAWSWISRPGNQPYQNQNWHRDSAEPFNFIRVFIPLGPIESREDGPTEMIPATSGLREFYDVRRFADEELEPLKIANSAGVLLSNPGDVYFVNTFGLHRGTLPQRPRAMLTLLVSLSPSHRTPAIKRIDMRKLSAPLRTAIKADRRFFRHLV